MAKAWLFGKREFEGEDGIKKLVATSDDFEPGKDGDVAKATPRLIFETRSQHTWLVATRARLYCVLDDIRSPEAELKWSLVPKETDAGDIHVRSHDAKPDRFGLVDITSRHKDWLYSRDLFVAEPIDAVIRDLMAKAAGDTDKTGGGGTAAAGG
jgi:hypothetical protein